MQRLQQAAEISVARGCGFAALAIFTFMVGFAGDIRLSLAVGGCMALLATFVLVIKALNTERTSYKRTEVWIMLEPEDRPLPEVAQKVIGQALREVYLRFAIHAAKLALGLLAASFLIRLVDLAA